jgi:hypothetical protein
MSDIQDNNNNNAKLAEIEQDLTPVDEDKLQGSSSKTITETTTTTTVTKKIVTDDDNDDANKKDNNKNDNEINNKSSSSKLITKTTAIYDNKPEPVGSGSAGSPPSSPKKPNNNKNDLDASSIPAGTVSPYRSTIGPRSITLTRRPIDKSYNSSYYSPIVANAISMRPSGIPSASLAIKENRLNEKRQLCELNDRFAGYVERVRFLEAQNKKLAMELSILKGKWGQETKQIETMYKIELDEARNVLNDTSKSKANIQVKLTKTEEELEEIKRRYFY